MNALKKKLHKSGGFTLVEMLIVVAIIAILVAVSIPLVNSALHKANDATDNANERAAKAVVTIALLDTGEFPDTFTLPASSADGTKYLYYNADTGELDISAPSKKYGKCSATHDDDNDFVFNEDATGAADKGAHVNKVIRIAFSYDNGVKVVYDWN